MNQRPTPRSSKSFSTKYATFFIGMSTVIVTAIGVFYVAKTLTATGQTLTAANETNEIMRQEQRPWVTLRRDVECDYFEKPWGVHIAWNHNFENLGRSPAHNIRLRMKAVRRNGLIGMKAELANFIDDKTRSVGDIDQPILFSGEKTDYWRFYSEATLDFTLDKAAPEGNETVIYCALTYELDTSSKPKIGVEGRVFQCVPSDRFMGRFGHQMLEHAIMRIVR